MRHVTLLLLAAAAAQTTIAATIHVPLHHGTIQAAIDAAEPGDTIRVAPGTYREHMRRQ